MIVTRMWASHVAHMAKNLPAKWETQVGSLGPEEPLKKGMATHSSILAWKTPWTEESDWASPWGHRESDMTEPLSLTHSPECNNGAFWVGITVDFHFIFVPCRFFFFHNESELLV